MSDESTRGSTGKVARLFDVRRVIGGLFVVYGVVITVAGLLDSEAEISKAQGVNINLWTGLIMLVLGILFLLWQWWRPLNWDRREDTADEHPARQE